MKLVIGDILKIAEYVPHNKGNAKRITIGIIEFMDSKKITIRKIRNGEKTFLTSFNIADLKDRTKYYFKKENNSWTPIKFKITEPSAR